MILSTSNITLIVSNTIYAFLINENIGNNRNTYKKKQKDHNLAMKQQKIKKKSAGNIIA